MRIKITFRFTLTPVRMLSSRQQDKCRQRPMGGSQWMTFVCWLSLLLPWVLETQLRSSELWWKSFYMLSRLIGLRNFKNPLSQFLFTNANMLSRSYNVWINFINNGTKQARKKYFTFSTAYISPRWSRWSTSRITGAWNKAATNWRGCCLICSRAQLS